ncbi:hypothetical protein [Burkholderia territorii]|uniref:hypothetical protein n=1 Tax=Burkholderia territorii TaxID=1503055 RepID=UPI002ED7F6E4
MRNRRGGAFGLTDRFHESAADNRIERTFRRPGIRRRTIGVRAGRVAGFCHATRARPAAIGSQCTGRSHGNTVGRQCLAARRCVDSGRTHDIGIAIGQIAVSGRRRRHRRFREIKRRLDRTANGTRRAEPVQHRLPPGVVLAVRDGGRRAGIHRLVIARNHRPTHGRLEHRIAEQVERAFVAWRIAARRIAGPRGCPRGIVCRGRDGTRTRTRTGRRAVGAGTGARQGNGFGHGVG